MKPAVALLLTSSAALLLAAAYQAQRIADATAPDTAGGDTTPNWADEVDAMFSQARDALSPSPVAGMEPSAQLLQFLRGYERLSLTPYRLGDGGWTIGYGHYTTGNGPAPDPLPDQAAAEALFQQDVEQRGARWVRTYVTVPLTQQQFDALTSMAFNLRPSSFATIADAVNAGQDPEDAALQFVRAGTNLEAGLRNRRAAELAIYREGVYA